MTGGVKWGSGLVELDEEEEEEGEEKLKKTVRVRVMVSCTFVLLGNTDFHVSVYPSLCLSIRLDLWPLAFHILLGLQSLLKRKAQRNWKGCQRRSWPLDQVVHTCVGLGVFAGVKRAELSGPEEARRSYKGP